MNHMPLLLSDTYKQTHDRMYPESITKLVSYWTPRKNMAPGHDKMVFFGLQEFISKFLVDGFNNSFFERPLSEIMKQYQTYMDTQLGHGNYDVEKVRKLWMLGYLPLKIRALPEGTLVNMGIPCIEITNTHPEFAWLVQWVECILQSELWAPCCYATIGYDYRQVANKYYSLTADDSIDPGMAMADFGMRGMSCLEDSIHASAAWLISFNKTSTIPALAHLDNYYRANCAKNKIGIGAVSTEHSVMGANFAIDGDEITFVKKLLTELYPNTSFSMVSDTYDYWNMVENILPQCKEEIMNHNGKLLVRPDSGDIIDISIKTIESLWKNFGGTYNSKGYKVLDPHIGIIYGDGCTLTRVKTIYQELMQRGFAANNIVFGVGAFCFHGFFEDDKFWALTRDTFGIAMKATYGEFGDKKVFIFKDPKTDTDHLKKSHKGCCMVWKDDEGNYHCGDTLMGMCSDEETELKTVFHDGHFTKFYSFEKVRNNLYN